MKYRAKHDIKSGAKLKIKKQKTTSYGILKPDEIVTVIDTFHFPTRFEVEDKNGKNWVIYTHDFEEINEE